ncbi:MAG: hypothetical protein FD177_1700 [Desulfovibrionaceae bacterium]|nr:MAG: hypothetical protein FD177_1700 [Desulfovibrionaceae bacterium]
MSLLTFTTPVQGDRFLRAREVCARLGISKSTLYKYITEGRLPAPKKLGSRTSVWPCSQIDAVIMDIVDGEAA